MDKADPKPRLGPALAGEHAEAKTLSKLEAQAQVCQRCDLYRHATQLVFGEGPRFARLMFIGEQPGDQEDLSGRPFIGPAGKLFAECLVEAGIDRAECYVTNAVKHFKFEQRGKRRLHSRPNAGEIQRCSWWLGAELDLVSPQVVVALGATAAHALLGPSVKVTRDRGHAFASDRPFKALVTVHPSFLLRIPDRRRAEEERQHFVADLVTASLAIEATGNTG